MTSREILFNIINEWIKTHKTPIPRRKILEQTNGLGWAESTIQAQLGDLVKRGYIRKAVNKSGYVVIKTLSNDLWNYFGG